LYKNKIILDVGCGNGHLVNYFAKHGARLAVGTDIAFYYIQSGRKERHFFVYNEKLRQGENTNVSFINSDVRRLPFKDSSFEMVLAFALLHHINEKTNFISECRRILVAGGRLVVVDPNGGHFLRNIANRYARGVNFLTEAEEAINIAQLKKILTGNGFYVEEIKFESFFGDMSAQLAFILYNNNRILGKMLQYFTPFCFAVDSVLEATLFKLFPNLGWRFFVLSRKEKC
jgi:SAM-dependent methyltransferase